MHQHNRGFIMMEVIATLFMAGAALLTVVTCYQGILSLMTYHNLQVDGLAIAQKNMAALSIGAYSTGETLEETEKFKVKTSTVACEELPGTYKLQVDVYVKGKQQPAVNLVRYE